MLSCVVSRIDELDGSRLRREGEVLRAIVAFPFRGYTNESVVPSNRDRERDIP